MDLLQDCGSCFQKLHTQETWHILNQILKIDRNSAGFASLDTHTLSQRHSRKPSSSIALNQHFCELVCGHQAQKKNMLAFFFRKILLWPRKSDSM